MKRGESGLSLLVAVDKPEGMTSHDVVNRCRRIFGERRIGHTGTLDPLATGVLPICIGPATRLDKFLTGHDKRYRVTIRFGCETTTDDRQGEPTVCGKVVDQLRSCTFAREALKATIGVQEQLPPSYSAVKVDGKRAYELARKGESVDLAPRRVEIYDAELVGIADEGDELLWLVDYHVSKGTYIRSLVRDLGRELGCPAHVEALQRVSSGRIGLQECLNLDALEARGTDAALDPIRALGLRYAFCDEYSRFVSSGVALRPNQVRLNEPLAARADDASCCCMTETLPSALPPQAGELAALVVSNRLKALYEYDAHAESWKPTVVFSQPIARC